MRRRESKRTRSAAIVCLILLFLGLGGAAYFLLQDDALAITTKPIPNQTVNELTEFSVVVSAQTDRPSEGKLQYRLISAPPGMTVDQRGKLAWKPTEEQGPGSYQIVIQVDSSDPRAESVTVRFDISVKEINTPPVMDPIEDKTVKAGALLTFKVNARDADVPARNLRYVLEGDVPSGARIDPRTGVFRWTPGSAGTQKVYSFAVKAAESGANGLIAAREFKVRVMPDLGPLDLLLASLRAAGAKVESAGEEFHPPFTVTCHLFKIYGHVVRVFEYPSSVAASREAAQVSSDAARLFGKPRTWQAAPHFYRQESLIALYAGADQKVLASLESQFGKAFAVGKASEKPVVAIPPPVEPDSPELKQLVELYTKNKKIFVSKEYVTLRKIFADRFERQYQTQIKSGMGADEKEMAAWFHEHPTIKEELFLAIDPKHDNIPAVIGLFAELRKQFPETLERYWNLAIATAVTWDNARAVYDYTHHQRRTHSDSLDGLAGAIDNFKYFPDMERFMQGRARFLPWEFLLHLVNHKTPLAERNWAIRNYLGKRAMIGKCYHDVPYDMKMLETNSKVCKLAGKPYTLPNLRAWGGVCAMQADFAARVGKSLGVPAAYVGGMSASGEGHAWVMWVELKKVTENSIVFSLESHGRYLGDKYYVGTLKDPQTGKGITDRELELRLQTVGLNPRAKRQAELIMAAYPMLRDELKMDVEEQLLFLNKVITLCPGSEEAWHALAAMSRDGTITNKQVKRLKQAIENLFRIFAKMPDFTWKVFDDLIAYYDKPREKNALYRRLIGLYVKSGRPDLTCEARLKLTDYLLKQEKPEEAVRGLSATILAFPDEGRYVPRMLDKLELICQGIEGSDPLVVQFYKNFLPTIPQMSGDRPSPYCMKMFQRGIDRFKQAGQTALAQAYEGQLAKIRSGMGRKQK